MAVEAHYQRYRVSYVEECDTVDQAFLFLASGEESGDLSSVKVVDGATVYDRNDPEFERRILAAYDALDALV